MPSSDSPSPRAPIPWKAAVVVTAIWVGIGMFTAQSSYLVMRRSGGDANWMRIFSANLLSVLLWAAFTPFMVRIARRVPFGRGSAVRPAVIHTLACLGFAVADVVIEHLILVAIGSPTGPAADLVALFLRRLFLNSLCYVAVVAIATVIDYARTTREREAGAVRLAAQLTEARMQALQAQLRPHFLFNTLSMIAEQVHHDPAGADRMIGRLSHLLRVSLSSTEHHEVTLAEERESLAAYLDIMDVRLSGRVRVNVDISADLAGAMVPTLILQPLAENAFRHGIEPMRRDAELSVRARATAPSLEIVIADNGRGVDAGAFREGVGLRVVRERLEQMYGAAAAFELRPRVEGGTEAVVRLPLHFAPIDAKSPTARHVGSSPAGVAIVQQLPARPVAAMDMGLQPE
jgi:two-component system, LytTR family, sensor kinase